MNNSRICWVDYAKGIAIILVVFAHSGGIAYSKMKLKIEAVRLINVVDDSFVMQLFFFLSGMFFLMSLKKRGGTGLVLNKLETIMYPYIVWSLLYGFLQITFSSVTNQHLTISRVLSFLWKPIGHLWFLYALFFVFFVWTLIFSAISTRWYFFLFLVSIIIFLIGDSLPKPTPLHYIVNDSVFFLMGGVFYKYQEYLFNKKRMLLLVSFFLFIVSHYTHLSEYSITHTYSNLEGFWLASISIIFVISLCMSLSSFRFVFLQYIGKHTMEIYLMHILTGSSIRIVLIKLMGIENIYIHMVIGMVSGILLPIVIAEFARRNHFEFIFCLPERFKLVR